MQQPSEPNRIMRPMPPQMMPQAQQPGGFQITPKDIISILLRHVLMIIIFTVIGTMIGGVSWYLLLRFKPLFTAKTAINVLTPGTSDPLEIRENIPNKDLYYQFRLTKAAYMKQQSFLQELLKRDAIRETQWFRGFNSYNDAYDNLEQNLQASAQRDGNWIVVSMTCSNKQESAKIVNEAVDLYIAKQREISTADIRSQLRERNTQAEELQAEKRRLEANLQQIRDASEFSEITSKGNFEGYLSAKVESVEIEYNNLESEMANLARLVQTLRVRAEGDYDPVVRDRMERDPIASNMRRNIAALEINLAELLARFGENHRRVIEARRALDKAKLDYAERRTQIADVERQANLVNAQDQLTILNSELEKLAEQRDIARQEYKRLENTRAEYAQNETQLEDVQDRLEQVTLNINKLEILYDSDDISKVQKIGDAPEPLAPSFPSIIVFVPAGFILGFMAGVGLAFLIELLNDTIRTPKDATNYLRTPLLGMIFHEDEDEYLDPSIDPRLVVQQAPYSIMSESYRQLKTNLKLSGPPESRKAIFLTSCQGGDGKTSIASNLAATYAAEGKKVLMIDTNFRKPALTELYPPTLENGETKTHADKGLSNYLMGQCEAQQVIRPSGLANMDIIDSGPVPQNPGGLIANARMNDLLRNVKEEYDFVIIDGPPMLVSDTKTLAYLSDAVLMVINAGTTKRGEAMRILRELKETQANVAGSVLLGVKTLRGGYFQEIFKSYHDYQPAQLPQTTQA